jgi:hypothetical protein
MEVFLASGFVSLNLAEQCMRHIATAIDELNETGVVCHYPDSITLEDRDGKEFVFPFTIKRDELLRWRIRS